MGLPRQRGSTVQGLDSEAGVLALEALNKVRGPVHLNSFEFQVLSCGGLLPRLPLTLSLPDSCPPTHLLGYPGVAGRPRSLRPALGIPHSACLSPDPNLRLAQVLLHSRFEFGGAEDLGSQGG